MTWNVDRNGDGQGLINFIVKQFIYLEIIVFKGAKIGNNTLQGESCHKGCGIISLRGYPVLLLLFMTLLPHSDICQFINAYLGI